MYATGQENALQRDYRGLNAIPIVGQTSIVAISPVFYRDPQLLAVLDEIVKRESNGNPSVCNAESGCKAGQGLTQLIPSTVKYCEEKLGKEIDPFNSSDNLECAMWLLDNEGIEHWEEWSGPY